MTSPGGLPPVLQLLFRRDCLLHQGSLLGGIYVVRTQCKAEEFAFLQQSCTFPNEANIPTMQNSYMYFSSTVPLGSQITTSNVLWLGKSTTERRGKQEDRRLYETASRAEVLERTACESRPSSTACRSRVSHPIKQPQPDEVSIWVHLD